MLLLAASLCLNVYLGWKIKQVPVAENRGKLLPGMKIDPITAIGADGKSVTISYGGSTKPTVFYVISPSCIWCKRNQANINKLIDSKGNDFRFIGISLAESGLNEYTAEHHLRFPVYTGLKAETIGALGLGGTPQTIVVSPTGNILKVWAGAYVEQLRPEVETYFGVQLPGLTSLNN